MIKIRIAFFFLSLITILQSCNRHNPNKISLSEIAFSTQIFSEDSFWLNIKKGYDSIINLKSIEKGVDSFEFRLWIDRALIVGKDLFIVKFEKGKWLKYHYYYYNDTQNIPFSKEDFSKLQINLGKQPFFISHSFEFINNDSDFIKLLKQYPIEILPTQASVKGFTGGCLDGVAYYFEIAKKNSYKFCVYENPECCCATKLKQSKEFIDFLNSFKKALQPDEYCWPKCIVHAK